ncbi:hypothetical protein EA797_03985 [Stutzerimonas zhaodongensis]|uniref:Uncharacterized protein n=2 Tax=Stutzerimonas zhaodongensis TaxID=1176257 RepID=A0A3M2HQA3_9GAMM|nr:hypothetical protein [Stutzerimonas zhaodongensis]MCQ4318627.1 hypothetical protein [Stutzerimonas zhaodongensis]RMH91906.1 hypothetical protein EA797_03985 [Stutzerimonas zhaodongensis]
MDVWSQVKVSAVQKAMQLSWLIGLLTIITFADCYLILKHGSGVSILSFEWIKTNIDIRDLIIGTGLFSFVFAAVIPGFWFIVWPFLQIALSKITNSSIFFGKMPSDGFTRAEVLMARAAKEGNMALLRYCEQHKQDIETRNFISTCAQGILVLTFTAWALSPPEVLPTVFEIQSYVEQFPWYIEKPVNGSLVLFYMAVVVMSFMRKTDSDNYIGIVLEPKPSNRKLI